MRSRVLFALLGASMMILSSCATSGSGTSSTRGSRDVITREELMTQERGSAYDAVARLRPRWLQSRGVGSVTSPTRDTPRVYVDGQLYGDVNSLHQIDMRDIQQLRYMSASDATTRYGTNHTAGAIIITTVRG